uniref:Uncharacterized protein n=1 Tax=Arundo donax TaxID=35708 RepID=A0A0A9E4H0_ARUDO
MSKIVPRARGSYTPWHMVCRNYRHTYCVKDGHYTLDSNDTFERTT